MNEIRRKELPSTLLLLPALAVWLVGGLVFWPGFWNPDTLDQWCQTLTGHYYEHHPLAHTLMMRGLRRIWDHPAAHVLTQVIVLWGSAVYAMTTLRRPQDSRIVWLLVAGLLAIHPAYLLVALDSQKDTFFAALLLLATAQVSRIVDTNGEWLQKPHALAEWLAVHALLVVLRSYFFLLPLATAVWLLLPARRHAWKARSPALILSIVILASGLNAGIDTLVDSPPTHHLRRQLGFNAAHLAGAIIHHGGAIRDEEWQVLDRVVDRTVWPGYTRFCGNSIVFNPHFNQDAMLQHWAEWIGAIAGIAARNPGATIRHFWGMASYTLSPWPLKDQWTFIQHFKLPSDGFGWRECLGEKAWAAFTPLFAKLNTRWAGRVEWFNTQGGQRLLRPAWMLWPVLGLLCWMGRRGTVGWVFAAPLLLHVVIMASLMPTNHFRYNAPLWIMAPFILAWLVNRSLDRKRLEVERPLRGRFASPTRVRGAPAPPAKKECRPT